MNDTRLWRAGSSQISDPGRSTSHRLFFNQEHEASNCSRCPHLHDCEFRCSESIAWGFGAMTDEIVSSNLPRC